ncbi:MAG: AraC family transcriptional regulator ligand-binding domain-containing protein, partial [Anaerolineales bacterium]|nr:AraC family transcriptional regulator ligand-binding domain-containing protein [Anaerolineales bacterium]
TFSSAGFMLNSACFPGLWSIVMPQYIPTISLQAILADAIDMGVDVKSIFRSLGLPFSPRELQQGKPPKIRADQFSKLYQRLNYRLITQTDQLQGRRNTTEAEFTLLCHCVITAETLAEVLERTLAYYNLLHERYPGSNTALLIEGDEATFILEYGWEEPDRTQVSIEARTLYLFYFFFSWLLGQPIKLISLQQRCPQDMAEAAVEARFDCTVRHLAPYNGFSFAVACLKRPNVRSATELRTFLKYYPGMMIESHSVEEAPLKAQVRQLMMNGFLTQHYFPSLGELAILFSMAPSTLSRDLRRENSGYASVKKDCQIEIAKGYLDNSQLSIDDISALMGFHDTNSFRRAFRQWTGTPPSQYRKSGQ